jgi:hypothetical protein
MKKRNLAVTLALCLILGLVLVLAMVTYAQGPEGDDPGTGEVESQDEISGQGLSDPPPSGWEVLYMFTGAVDNANATTVIHCTNFGSVNAEVKVEIFNYYDTSTTSATISIRSDETKTFSTRSTAIYEEDAVLPSIAPIDQGSGRVLSPESDIICTAQVLDPTNNPPEYMVNLQMFKQKSD